MLRASQMAVFDVADDSFLLMTRDTAGTPDGADAAGREMLARGARLLLGPLFWESVAAAVAPARDAGINLIAFSRFSEDLLGQALALFAIALTVAEVVVGLAIVILIYRTHADIDADTPSAMRG